MSQAEGCLCMWCLADGAGTVTFSSMLLCSVRLHFYHCQGRNVPLLTGKPSLLPEAKEGRLCGAGLQQERKGSLPKGIR